MIMTKTDLKKGEVCIVTKGGGKIPILEEFGEKLGRVYGGSRGLLYVCIYI